MVEFTNASSKIKTFRCILSLNLSLFYVGLWREQIIQSKTCLSFAVLLHVVFGLLLTLLASSVHSNAVKESLTSSLLSTSPIHFHLTSYVTWPTLLFVRTLCFHRQFQIDVPFDDNQLPRSDKVNEFLSLTWGSYIAKDGFPKTFKPNYADVLDVHVIVHVIEAGKSSLCLCFLLPRALWFVYGAFSSSLTQ